MARHDEHDLFKKRGRSNRIIGLLLGTCVLLIMAVTIVKMTQGDNVTHPIGGQTVTQEASE